MSIFDVFAASQETLAEAKEKRKREQSTKLDRFQIKKDGTYAIRFLPIAPIRKEDGTVEVDRKGYEYPVKELLLKILIGKTDKGEDKFKYQTVCHTGYAFPSLKNDLIDLYVRLACETYKGKNEKEKEAFCKKIRGNSFGGGLKYDSKRYSYILDLANRAEGPKLYGQSFSLYSDLEDLKGSTWGKLLMKDPNALCPVCSPLGAYPVEVTRSKDGAKTKYKNNIDILAGECALTSDELTALMNMPRLPEVLYKYRRLHLEATVEFLKQVDERYSLNVMDMDEIKECIEQISLLLPADDQSHFTTDTDQDSNEGDGNQTIDDLWETYQNLEDAGIDDHSEEGQELRIAIKEYIDAHNLDIKVTRKKSNGDLLQAIDELEGNGTDDEEEEEEEDDAPAPSPAPRHAAPVDEPEDEDDEEEEEEDEEDPEPSPAPSRRSRNDDTNEPAARPERRSVRPARRRQG